MRKRRIEISAGFILLFSALYFFDDSGWLLALAPAVAAHELGHALCLMISGCRITKISFGLTGLEMNYQGILPTRREIVVAAAGPAFGLLYAFAASMLGRWLESDLVLLSSGLSIILSFFNLLPALPLDGGRMVHAVAETRVGYKRSDAVVLVTSTIVGEALVVAGLFMWNAGYGAALVISGLWILAANWKFTCKNSAYGIR